MDVEGVDVYIRVCYSTHIVPIPRPDAATALIVLLNRAPRGVLSDRGRNRQARLGSPQSAPSALHMCSCIYMMSVHIHAAEFWLRIVIWQHLQPLSKRNLTQALA